MVVGFFDSHACCLRTTSINRPIAQSPNLTIPQSHNLSGLTSCNLQVKIFVNCLAHHAPARNRERRSRQDEVFGCIPHGRGAFLLTLWKANNVCGYAVTLDNGNYRVINLKTGKTAYIMASGEFSETNMDEVESEIAMRIVSENRKYITAA